MPSVIPTSGLNLPKKRCGSPQGHSETIPSGDPISRTRFSREALEDILTCSHHRAERLILGIENGVRLLCLPTHTLKGIYLLTFDSHKTRITLSPRSTQETRWRHDKTVQPQWELGNRSGPEGRARFGLHFHVRRSCQSHRRRQRRHRRVRGKCTEVARGHRRGT